jgi:RNA polymerase subunit RPABC4/transcription elongation factor Spt4
MPSFVNTFMDFLSSPSFEILKFAVLGYFGLLWLAIIIWVTRDSIHRSNSLIFQTFSILINIAIPILGVLLYLIIRPNRTNMERYYEDLESRLLAEDKEDKEKGVTCEKCMTVLEAKYTYCPSCGTKTKRACRNCKEDFPTAYNICPFCGTENEKEVRRTSDSSEENAVVKMPVKRAPRKPSRGTKASKTESSDL